MSRTLYPLADGAPEHDAGVGGPFLSWSALCASAGNLVDAAGVNFGMIYIYTGAATTGLWRGMVRSAVIFDTSSISSSTTIISATVKIRGYAKNDGPSLDINIYGASTSSDSAVVAGDFSVIGSTPYCDTPISYTNWSTSGYNSFVLNTAGRNAINKGGVTKFGFRNASYDVAGVPPAWPGSNQAAGLFWWAADYGVDTSPLLVLTTTSNTGTSYYEEGEGLKATDIVTLAAIRNLELTCMGHFRVDKEGNARYEDRYYRNT